jgi:hypothetical protein
VPTADADFERGQLTVEEQKGPSVQVHVIPVGYVLPPIIYLDSAGMPREKYRNPLEYPPVIYHVKTKKGTVRMLASQNQIGPSVRVPKLPLLTLSYQVPTDPSSTANTDPTKGPRLQEIAEFTVPTTATHLAIVIWKDPNDSLWTHPQFKVVDISPDQTLQHQAIVINVSSSQLALETGNKPYLIQTGYIGKVALPMNDQNQLMMVVEIPVGAQPEPLIQTAFDVQSDQRAFLLAWSVPKDAARSHGVAITSVAKVIYEAPTATKTKTP